MFSIIPEIMPPKQAKRVVELCFSHSAFLHKCISLDLQRAYADSENNLF